MTDIVQFHETSTQMSIYLLRIAIGILTLFFLHMVGAIMACIKNRESIYQIQFRLHTIFFLMREKVKFLS